MKTRLLNLICLLACVAAGTTLGNAQDVITVLKSRYAQPQQFQSVSNIDFDKSQYQMVKSWNGNESYVKKDMLATSKKKFADAGDYVPVTLVFNMPEELAYNILDIRMFNQETSFWLPTWEMSDNMLVTEVPQGTYQLLCEFELNSDDPISQGCTLGVIAKEDVTINQEATITFNFADAKNVIYMEKKLPNGETFVDADNYESVGDYTNESNVITIFGGLNIIDQDHGCISTFVVSCNESYYIDEDGVSHDQRFRLLVSDLSERYTLVMDHVALGLDEELNSCYTVQSIKTGVSESETLACDGNYKTVSSHVKPSILGENSTVKGIQADIMLVVDDCNTASLWGNYNTGHFNSQYNMHVCENGDVLPNNCKKYYNATLAEYLDMSSFSLKKIQLPWGDISGEEVVYQSISPSNDFRYNLKPNGENYIKPNSTFSFKESEVTDCFGNSAPVNVIGYNYEASGMKYSQFLCDYIGRMGEIRESDNFALDFSLSYNGEEVCTDYQECMNGWIWEWIYGGHEDGAYDATLVNQNMMVDDMQGCNTTKVHYDTRNQDFTPPTATMLQFRNAEDNSVTDRFEAGEDGMMYLAAKDYNITLDENWAMGMECLPVNVKVSYAANGTDEWTEMVINEMPELFDEYSFGYIYATSLYQVMSASANKWYDLKIELSDEAGNWQEQVISPAFRIERGGSTGIEVVKANDATEVARYTVDGRAISAPQTGVNIVMMSDGTVRKVIVK